MGLDGGQSTGMPKSSSESSSKFSKSEFSDSEFAFGRGVKSKGGMDMRDGGRDIVGVVDVGGGDAALGGGNRGLGGGDAALGAGGGNLGGGDAFLRGRNATESN